MYVIVAFDISDESVRGKLRRYLRSLGLSMVNRSVYAGAGGRSVAERIKEKVSKIIRGGDSVFIILVQEEEYRGALVCSVYSCKRVEDYWFDIA
jgi:CRISPR-associated protein Cas2